MNEIVLGTARISRIDQKDANKLFNQAHRFGIKIMDTAPSYGDSGKKISIWKKQDGIDSKMRITSKLGAEQLSSTRTLNEALTQLQDLYDFDDIQAIFIHSIPITQINQKVLRELISLRDAGNFSQIGYAGDGADLEQAIQLGVFDAAMCTLNPIDNKNIKILNNMEHKLDVYAKRVMANYAWSLQNQIRINVLRRNNWVISEYRSRINKYMSSIPRNEIAREFVNYAISSNFAGHSIFGISSVTHLNKLFDYVNGNDLPKYNFPIVTDDPIT